MRITREALLKAARDFVGQRARSDRDLVSVYLVGSLLTDEPLLGGTVDIDLIFVQSRKPSQFREVVRLTNEITLDIGYYNETEYRHPRHLRLNPWVGSSLCETRNVLYDTQHWFEFTQSSVGSQFYTPENVLARSKSQSEKARNLWMDLQTPDGLHSQNVLVYLKSLKSAANAVACLSGSPLTDRRFLLNFHEKAEVIDQPGLNAGLMGLLGSGQVDADIMKSWLPDWRRAITALQEVDDAPIRLHRARLPYYERALEALLEGEQPDAATWPLMRTWTLACRHLPTGSAEITAWEKACQQLNLGPDQFAEKVSALDAFLDNIEETLEDWGQQYGIE